jgi:hypothetical protein
MKEEEELKKTLQQELLFLEDTHFNRQVLQLYKARKATASKVMSLSDERLTISTAILALLSCIGLLLSGSNGEHPDAGSVRVLILVLITVPLFMIVIQHIHQKAGKSIS